MNPLLFCRILENYFDFFEKVLDLTIMDRFRLFIS